MAEFIETLSDANGIALTGDWTLPHITAISERLASLSQDKPPAIQARLDHLDTAGAMILSDAVRKLGYAPDQIQGLAPQQQALLDLVAGAKQEVAGRVQVQGPVTQFVILTGQNAVAAWHNTLDLLRFLGQTIVELGGVISHPRRLRFASIARHVRETGLDAIPIVSLIAFLISIVLAYQGANQLQRFGAQIFTINMIAISVLREMGVLLTAIIIAGRSGSAFTAEIGVMKVNEEVDAMQIIGARPFEVLVIPRLIALMITLPLLAFIADMMGLLGGGLTSVMSLDVNLEQFIHRFQGAVKVTDFWVGMIKAPVFAFFIAIVGCMRGMQVSGSAESVGRLTTTSVVQSIFLVLLLDALFSILFTKLGI